jgi:hypothetical protein
METSMARYSILALMRTLGKPMPIAEAQTPADAVRIARDFVRQGKQDVNIGDKELEQYFPPEVFAAKHGIR